jgi:hypothetical protein
MKEEIKCLGCGKIPGFIAPKNKLPADFDIQKDYICPNCGAKGNAKWVKVLPCRCEIKK